MNREEEFEKAASEYAQYEVWGSSYDDVWEGFVDGAKWADEHTATLWHSVKDGELPQAGKNCIFSYQGIPQVAFEIFKAIEKIYKTK